MRIHDPKLRTLAHALSLSVSIAFKGTNSYIIFLILYGAFLYCILYVTYEFIYENKVPKF